MSINKTIVTGPVYLPNCEKPEQSKIVFELSSWDKEDNEAVFVSGPYVGNLDENGDFSVELFTNNNGENNTVYRVSVIYINVSGEYKKEFIGTTSLSGPGPFCIADLNFVNEFTTGTFDVLAQVASYAATAENFSDNAEYYFNNIVQTSHRFSTLYEANVAVNNDSILPIRNIPLGSSLEILNHTTPGDGGGIPQGIVEATDNLSNPGGGKIKIASPTVIPRMWGDDDGSIKNAIEYGKPTIEIDGLTSIDSIQAVMQSDLHIRFHPNAILRREAIGDEIAFSIDTNGYDLFIDGGGLIDGQNLVPILGQIVNNTTNESRVQIQGGPVWQDAYRRVTDGTGSASGLWIRGLIRPTIENVVVNGVSREIGGGIVGSSGSSGIAIFSKNVSGINQWPVAPQVIGCRCDDVTSEEVENSATNYDCDALKIATGASTNDGASSDRCVIRNFSALNPKGRAIKTQVANVDIDGVSIRIRDGKPSITDGGSLINCQSSPVVRINNVEAFITAYQSTNWFGGGYQGSLIGLYTSNDNDRPGPLATISNVTANVWASAGNGFEALIAAESGYSRDRATTLVATNINAKTETEYLLLTAISEDNSPQNYTLTNVHAKKIAVSAVAHNSSGDIQNRVQLINCGHNGSEVPAITLRSNPTSFPATPVEGYGLYNIINTATSAGDRGTAPSRIKTIVPGDGNVGGAINFEGMSIGDDEIYVCRPSGSSLGRGLISISTSFGGNAQAIFAAANPGLTLLNAAGATNFAIGNGSNPDSDGLINIWIADNNNGDRCLHIKNRLGSTRSFTIQYQG